MSNEIDMPPKDGVVAQEENENQKDFAEVPPYMHFFKPEVITKFMHKKFLLFTPIVGVYYILQFIMCVSACNFYSDATRNAPCGKDENGTIISGSDASAIMDNAMYLVGIYHIMEWIRATILLTVILIGVNLMWVWYVTSVISLYGFGCFIYLVTVFFGDDAKGCEDSQPTRYQWLLCETIYFFCIFFPAQFPVLIVRCFKRESIYKALSEDDDEDGDMDDKEKEEEEKRKLAKERKEKETMAYEAKKTMQMQQ